MRRSGIVSTLTLATLVCGCATQPLGPTARVMPAPGKPFPVFAQDQSMCKQFADGEVGGGAALADMKILGAAALSTALGGGLGAAIHGARGAEVGGAMGAVSGAMLAARGSGQEQAGLQGRYDLAYSQCMYARGNQVAAATPGPARPAVPMAGTRVGMASPLQPPMQMGGPGPLGGLPMGLPGGFLPQLR